MPIGAKCLFNVATDEAAPGMIEREIVRRVEANTGRKSGRWEVTVCAFGVSEDMKKSTTTPPAPASTSATATTTNTTAASNDTNSTATTNANQQQRRIVETVAFSDIPERLFLIMPGTSHMTEVEPSMVPLMTKISPLRQRARRVVRGDEYDFEDFCVRVGVSFDKHNTPTGVVVEIEYRPCAFVTECEALITELMDKIAAPLVPPPQASPDPAVGVAASNRYAYKIVRLEDKKIRKGDLYPYSNRTSAWLYSTLLAVAVV